MKKKRDLRERHFFLRTSKFDSFNKFQLKKTLPYILGKKKKIGHKKLRKQKIKRLRMLRKLLSFFDDVLPKYLENYYDEYFSIEELFELYSILSKATFKSKGVEVHFYDWMNNKFFKRRQGSSPGKDSKQKDDIVPKLEPFQFCCKMKKPVTANVLKDNRSTESQTGYKGSSPVVYIPCLTPFDQLFAVIEMFKEFGARNYNLYEVMYNDIIVSLISRAVLLNKETIMGWNRHIFHKCMRSWVEMAPRAFNFERALHNMMVFMTKIIGGEKSTLYVVTDEVEPTAIIYEYISSSGYEQDITKGKPMRLTRNHGLVVACIETRQIYLIQDPEDMEKLKEYIVEEDATAIFMCPCVIDEKVVGVLKVVKNDGELFDEYTEDFAERFGLYSAFVMRQIIRARSITTADIMHTVTTNRGMKYLEPRKIPLEAARKDFEDNKEDIPVNMFTFLWYPSRTLRQRHLVRLAHYLFQACLGDAFMKNNDVTLFILMVENGYRNNPYHNFEHAFNVAHCMANILIQNKYREDDAESIVRLSGMKRNRNEDDGSEISYKLFKTNNAVDQDYDIQRIAEAFLGPDGNPKFGLKEDYSESETQSVMLKISETCLKRPSSRYSGEPGGARRSGEGSSEDTKENSDEDFCMFRSLSDISLGFDEEEDSSPQPSLLKIMNLFKDKSSITTIESSKPEQEIFGSGLYSRSFDSRRRFRGDNRSSSQSTVYSENESKMKRRTFKYWEVCAFLIAAICHDIDHPARTNNFLKDTNHIYTRLYNKSFLENHHSEMTVSIIKHCHLLRHCSRKVYRILVREICRLIMATDIQDYWDSKETLMMTLGRDDSSRAFTAHRRLLKNLMMTVCDISGNCKPFKHSRRVSENLYREFYAQGDIMKKLGKKPISLMDRTRPDRITLDQIYFLDQTCIPATDLLSRIFPNTYELLWSCWMVRDRWEEIEKELKKLGLKDLRFLIEFHV